VPYKAVTLKPAIVVYRKARLSAKDRGYDREHRAWRKAILERDPICRMCGSERSTHADHIISVSKRPDLRLELSNGQGLGQRCHSIKTASQDGGFGNPIKSL